MLSSALPLKLSVAGIRLTGFVIETNFRIARVFGQAALKAGPFSMPVVKGAGLSKGPQVKPEAARDMSAPLRPHPVARAKPALRAPSPVAKPAEVKAVTEMPAPPVAKTEPKPAPVPSVSPAVTAAVPTPAKADSKPVVTPKAAPAAPAEPVAAKVKPAPVVASTDAAPTVAAPVAPAKPAPALVATPAEPAPVKRPRAPSMPPALPEAALKTKAE